MSDHTRRQDAEYWGLTWREQVAYFGRLSDYYGRRSAVYGAKAERYFRITQRLLLAQVLLWSLFLAIKLIGWVTR